MLRVRLICVAACWVILVPLVFVADLPGWPLGVVYPTIFVMVVSMLLLEERLVEREKRRRRGVGSHEDLVS